MERTLNQDDIDALLQAARSRKAAAAAPEKKVEPYSFQRAGQIGFGSAQMRALSLLNDLFARNLAHNLGAWLGVDLTVRLAAAEQVSFNDFLLTVPDLSYICSVRLDPLHAISVLAMDPVPALAMIDLLFGGMGTPGEVHPLTDIEGAILSSVTEAICRELNTAWEQVGISFHFEQRQFLTQITSLMTLDERTLCLSFEIRLPGSSGLLKLAFPAVVSNTTLYRLTEGRVHMRQHPEETRKRMLANLSHARVGVALQLPPVLVSAKAIESLHAGSILRLKLPAHEDAELRVAGVPLFLAQPVSAGEFRGAHLVAPVRR